MNAILMKSDHCPRRLMTLVSLLSLLLTACTDIPVNAPIDDRTNPIKSQKKQDESIKPAELIADKPGFYTVKPGDNLLRISKQFKQDIRDLVEWNKLSNANSIKVGETLRVQLPEGAQVASVKLDSGVETRPLNPNSAAPQSIQNPVPLDSGVEARPLNSKPAPSPPDKKPLSVVSKSGPLGDKIPYSDQALADLQRGEAGAPARGLDAPRKAVDTKEISGRFIWPTEGTVVQTFEESKKGIDITGQSGQPIIAAAEGTVLYAKNMRGYGNLIILDHTDGMVTAYAHNKTMFIREGQVVTKGQKIAEMGNVDSDIVKLHFEIRQLGRVIDPIPLLPQR
jgi:lipoprotein NlpD